MTPRQRLAELRKTGLPHLAAVLNQAESLLDTIERDCGNTEDRRHAADQLANAVGALAGSPPPPPDPHADPDPLLLARHTFRMENKRKQQLKKGK